MMLAARITAAVGTLIAAAITAPTAWAQQRFDVTLEVEPIVRGGAGGNPGTPGLAFTGAPIWVLLLTAAVLLGIGAVLVLAARDRRGRPIEA